MIPKTRILIVDDHAMVRLALAEAIAQQDDLELVGEAENGARAIALYRDLQPDVVTMDYQMPGLNGAEAIGEILAEFPEARIVLL
ncbi:response regulator transcription factor [Akkermansiaceae bacterium]|nr:response regulator transcription factor [Akkermansiaceae bacterium]